MNLHDITVSTRNWLWVQLHGQNGHYLATHMYELESGEPPIGIGQRAAWMQPGYIYWHPQRFAWTPYMDSLRNLFANGYARPICGTISRSRHPRASFSRNPYNACLDCLRIARERGIIHMTQSTACNLNPTYQHVQEEYHRWIDAGRPDQWP